MSCRTGDCTIRRAPSTSRRNSCRGTVIALRHGEVGMDWPYSQLFIQPIMMRLPPGTSLKVTAA